MTLNGVSAQSLTLERNDSNERMPSVMDKSICFQLDHSPNLEPLDDTEEKIYNLTSFDLAGAGTQMHKPKVTAMTSEDTYISATKTSSNIILPDISPNASPNVS